MSLTTVDELAANVAAIRARYGRHVFDASLPSDVSVTLPIKSWPAIDLPPPFVARGVTHAPCGQDQWTGRSAARWDCYACRHAANREKWARHKRLRRQAGAKVSKRGKHMSPKSITNLRRGRPEDR